jgi:hypothetical protein
VTLAVGLPVTRRVAFPRGITVLVVVGGWRDPEGWRGRRPARAAVPRRDGRLVRTCEATIPSGGWRSFAAASAGAATDLPEPNRQCATTTITLNHQRRDSPPGVSFRATAALTWRSRRCSTRRRSGSRRTPILWRGCSRRIGRASRTWVTSPQLIGQLFPE